MDLCHRGLDRQACRVLDAWLRVARGAEDSGLTGLPLFLSVRAAIRAMVLLQTDTATGRHDASAGEVASFLDLACSCLLPSAPRIIAVGGLSGSGKSALARALAPGLGARPGAVMLASDLERKAELQISARLDPGAYTSNRRAAVYDAMFARAATILAAGHSAILDATFIDPAQRGMAEEIAERARTPFLGLWLEAPSNMLEERLRERTKDASDADVSVLNEQRRANLGDISWRRIDAAGEPEVVLATARALISPKD